MPKLFLAEVVRRCGDVQKQARSGLRQLSDRVGAIIMDMPIFVIVPNVFADCQSQSVAGEIHDRV